MVLNILMYCQGKNEHEERNFSTPEVYIFFSVSFKISEEIICSPRYITKSPWYFRTDQNAGAKIINNGAHWHSLTLIHCSSSWGDVMMHSISVWGKCYDVNMGITYNINLNKSWNCYSVSTIENLVLKY